MWHSFYLPLWCLIASTGVRAALCLDRAGMSTRTLGRPRAIAAAPVIVEPVATPSSPPWEAGTWTSQPCRRHLHWAWMRGWGGPCWLSCGGMRRRPTTTHRLRQRPCWPGGRELRLGLPAARRAGAAARAVAPAAPTVHHRRRHSRVAASRRHRSARRGDRQGHIYLLPPRSSSWSESPCCRYLLVGLARPRLCGRCEAH